jgi:hypothetical protein
VYTSITGGSNEHVRQAARVVATADGERIPRLARGDMRAERLQPVERVVETLVDEAL